MMKETKIRGNFYSFLFFFQVLQQSDVIIQWTFLTSRYITSKFWCSPLHGGRWKRLAQPKDLREDSQDEGRVEVLDTERGNTENQRPERERFSRVVFHIHSMEL